jgi:hypothetical protein
VETLLARTVCLVYLFALLGCGTYYRDVSADAAHASLKFEGSWGLFRAQTTIPLSINGIPANGGRWTGREFRIAPGETIMVLHTAEDGFHAAECVVEFKAIAGRVYTVTDKPDGDFLQMAVTDDIGAVVASARPRNNFSNPKHEFYQPVLR